MNLGNQLSLSVLVAAAAVPPFAMAAKDSDYYRPGMSNPNVDNKMYWKDSINVLQDLDQFQSLYIKYEGCVWSKWGSRYSQYEADEDGGADESSSEKGCGGGGDGDEGEDFWYLGRTQCFRANAAFTLYGVLKDETVEPKNGEYCGKGTFINSFFTTVGVESFSAPLGLDTSSANSYCTMTAPDDDAQMYYYAENNDDNDGNENIYTNYAAYTSSGTACQNQKFVINKYQGAFCDGADGYIDTTNYLESFNEGIESLGCIEIYNANSYNANQRDRKLENNDDDYYDYLEEEDNLNPVDILKFSRACSIRQYPIQCPDPYGLLNKYDKALTRALTGASPTWKSAGEKVMNAFSAVFLVVGAALLFLSFRVKRRIAQKPMVTTEKEAEPAPASKLAQKASNISAMSASAASSVKEAFEQVFSPRKKQEEKEKQAEWEKQRGNIIGLVDLDDSIATSVGSVSAKGGSVKDDSTKANPVLAWGGEEEKPNDATTSKDTLKKKRSFVSKMFKKSSK